MYRGVFGIWDWPFNLFGNLVELLLGLAALIFWIFMIVDCAQRKFKKKEEKIVWIVVLILSNWVGAIVYYFVVREYNPKGIWK